MTYQSTNIEIHEFSTGIKPDRDSEGNWISRGFTGGYMNCTLPEIPYNVERAIANKLFAVVEGYTTEQPAVIGRVVTAIPDSPNQEGKLDWSVVAIVSRGRDEKGRPLSVYRYFLCQGKFGLLKIVAWIQKQKQELPIFNPFEKKEPGQPNILWEYSPPHNNLIIERYEPILEKNNIPTVCLLQEIQKVSLSDIHYFAAIVLQRNSLDQKSVSWAYNVEALEQPFSFIFINTANLKAYKRIQNALDSRPKESWQNRPAANFDLQMLTSAIKSLIAGSVSSKAVEPIFAAIENKQEVTEEVWQKLFDGEGASRAIKQSIYSPQMVRLLTLRAMTISRTLPEFLDWLSADYVKRNQAEFLEFSRVLKPQLTDNQIQYLQSSLFEGIREVFVLNKVSNSSPEFFDILIFVLTNADSLWNICLGRVIRSVYRDLELIVQTRPGMNLEGFCYSERLWQEIIRNWNKLESGKKFTNKEDTKKYLRFAKLFNQLSKYSRIGESRKKASKITSYFYQISKGEVPDKLFYNAFGSNKLKEHFLSLPIHRQLTFDEKAINQIIKLIKLSKTIVILVTKPIEFTGKFIWHIAKSIVEFISDIIKKIFGFIREERILNIFLISISMILISITIIISYLPQNLIDIAGEEENFNNSVDMLNTLLKNLPNKSLNKNEKLLFVINEMSLNELKDDCLMKDEENEQNYLFPQHKSIERDCGEKLVKNLIAYEENIVENAENDQIESDGIIDELTIKYIESQISGILDPEKERYKNVTVPILKEFVLQGENKIDKIKNSPEYKQLDINRWFLEILKQSIIPKDYSENNLQYSILKQLKEIDDTTEKYDKFIDQTTQGLPDKNSKYLQEWSERIFSNCMKLDQCQISSTKNDDQNIQIFKNLIIPNLISEVEARTTQYLNKYLNAYLDTEKFKIELEQKFTSKKKSLESARSSFETTHTNIKAIEAQIYQDILRKLNTTNIQNEQQAENIKKEIHNTVKKILLKDLSLELANINEINLDKVKNIKLDKLDQTIEFDHLEHFRNQLLWIKAIYDYQVSSNLTADGIISSSNSGTGGKLKEELENNQALINNINNIISKQ